MKELDFDHVLYKLESYKRDKRRGRSSSSSSNGSIFRNKENRDNNSGGRMAVGISNNPIDVDDYSSGDQESIASEASDLSTVSANRRLVAHNSVKLASHIMIQPRETFARRAVPLKDDPEFGLYFRMLRYGFTLGAVRAALQRDGKPDVTPLDPDRPVRAQRVPRTAQDDLERENRTSAGRAPGSDGGPARFEGLL